MQVMVKGRYVFIAIILAVLGALTLSYGQCIGFNDLVKGGITGFIFALIPVVVHIWYDLAKKEKEIEEERKSIFLGIYLELYESLEYLGDLFQSEKSKELTFIPPLSTTAWETACLRGYIRPQTAFGYNLRHIYEATKNFNYLMNKAVDTMISSSLPKNESQDIANGLIVLLRNIHISLVDLMKEMKIELENMLSISPDEINKRKEEIKTRIQKIRFKVSSKNTNWT